MDTSAASFLYISSTPNSSFKELLQTFPLQTFKKDDYLFKKSQPQKKIYYIESGKVLSVRDYLDGKRELVLGYYQTEQFINLALLTGNSKQEESAKAINRVSVRVIPIYEFQALMRQRPYINQLVLNTLGKELTQRNEQYYKNITLDSQQRVIAFLVDQIKYNGTRVGYEWVIRDFFTQLEIAQLTNTARQTVNVTMNNLRKKKLIHFRYKYFIVRELAVLEKLVNNEVTTDSI